MERANGFEPSTLTLARLCSTPELRPHSKPIFGNILKWSAIIAKNFFNVKKNPDFFQKSSL